MDETEKAVDYIKTRCPTIGAFSGKMDVLSYLDDVANAMDASSETVVFPGRYKEHVSYALRMIARWYFTSSAAAIASVYLATRFEFYFRILSGLLMEDGTWVSQAAQDSARAQISNDRLKGKRISSVALAYKLMKLDQSRPAAQVFASLDAALFPKPMIAVGKPISDIGERIERLRHPAGHGEIGDISSEWIFYGLVTAIVFYNQS